MCLCHHDHIEHHKGAFTIEGNADEPDGLIFRDRYEPTRAVSNEQINPDPNAGNVTDQSGHDPPATETAA